MCPNYKSDTAPICQPDRGSQLVPGKTYYGECCSVMDQDVSDVDTDTKNSYLGCFVVRHGRERDD